MGIPTTLVPDELEATRRSDVKRKLLRVKQCNKQSHISRVDSIIALFSNLDAPWFTQHNNRWARINAERLFLIVRKFPCLSEGARSLQILQALASSCLTRSLGWRSTPSGFLSSFLALSSSLALPLFLLLGKRLFDSDSKRRFSLTERNRVALLIGFCWTESSLDRA